MIKKNYIIIYLILLSSCIHHISDKDLEYNSKYSDGSGINIKAICVSSSGAGPFDTGTDYEWFIVDSLGHKIDLGKTNRDDFFNLKLRGDTLFVTKVMIDINHISFKEPPIYNYKETDKTYYVLSQYGFSIPKTNFLINEDSIINSLKENLVLIKGDTFNMCSRWSEIRGKTTNIVKADTFFISKYEVTQELWYLIMGYIPSFRRNCPKCPVESNWFEVNEFIRKLNAKYNMNFRLPTEIEWEYAARGGDKHYEMDDWNKERVDSMAWFLNNSSYITHNVGEKKPNEFGLYDMLGNASEWCSDWYDDEYEKNDTSINKTKVIKGGGCNSYFPDCIPSERTDANPKYGESGFRLAMDYNH